MTSAISAVAGMDRTAAPDATRSPPTPGFAHALRAADPASLPTVPLREMLVALAGSGPSIDYGSLASSPPSAGFDTWPGPATARPTGALATATPVATPLTQATSAERAVIRAGERYLGVPYVWGGTDPRVGLDCSGFVQQVYADLGIQLPRVSIDQSKAGVAVADLSAARPGDLVFWHGTGSRPNHIGMYAGDGQMLVAPRTGDVVRYQEITRTPDAIRRIL